ncbi:MAG: DNA/RNA nuclease SfsA [Deltaproteobacteria bacterium]|nr:DNA/RNA nuclease SfsA [Deltaproteobacteria bacterium]
METEERRPYFGGEIVKASFISRPNRFLVHCHGRDGKKIRAFLPNPGRLWELLLPGATLYLRRDGVREGKLSKRKTQHTALAVEREGRPIFLHTHETNTVARYLLENSLIPPLQGASIVQAEVAVGRSRFDFLLIHEGEELYLEVKSCTLFGNGVAMFPDAVTARGKRHILKLAEMSRKGIRASVLFIVHHPKVEWFMPDYHTDFDFSTAMLHCQRYVQFIPAAIGWNKDLSLDIGKTKILRIPWNYLKREVKDRGSYLLIVKLTKKATIKAGRLPKSVFPAGYYVYVGSAMSGLSSRLARHRRPNKKIHWHIDYLTAAASHILPLPIRSSKRQECEIAKALSSLGQTGQRGFGSSDCECATHLFYSPTNPLESEDFHQLLQNFRMRAP